MTIFHRDDIFNWGPQLLTTHFHDILFLMHRMIWFAVHFGYARKNVSLKVIFRPPKAPKVRAFKTIKENLQKCIINTNC